MNAEPREFNPAEHLNSVQQVLERLIARQFSRSTLLVVISLALFFGAYACLTFMLKTTPNELLLKQLATANTDLSRLAQQMATGGDGANASLRSDVVAAIIRQSDMHQQALKEFQTQQQKVSPEGVSFLQVLGGSAILVLLGYLGLQRLQNIDTEIQALRDFMFQQIRERVSETRETLRASVTDEVDKRFKKTRDDIATASDDFKNVIGKSKDEFHSLAFESSSRIKAVQGQVTDLLSKYAWLESDDMRHAANTVASLASVEQAHDAAQKFNHQKDSSSARLALRTIVDRKLTGGSDGFHNAHTEAMDMQDPILALEIIDAGLCQYPDQYDLIADKARVLVRTGRAAEAVALLEDWRRRCPAEFRRGWRPVVFYAHAVQALGLSKESQGKLSDAFEDVTSSLLHEIKPWAEHALVESRLGNHERAVYILEQGLKHNPYSQQLNYMLGELKLSRGEVSSALGYLERALSCDYQHTYQHDVPQEAVRTTLAQAYEAAGMTQKARTCYEIVVQTTDPDEYWHIATYAKSRLLALAVADAVSGTPPVAAKGDCR